MLPLQALLMPLFSITLVFNTIFAYIFLGERLTRMQILGTFLIVFGCAFAVAFGPKSDDVGYTASELTSMFENVPFLIYFGVTTVMVAIDYIIFKLGVFSNDTFLMLSYIGISGFFGSWNPLFAKCFIEILASSLRDEMTAARNSKHWLFYVAAIVTAVTTITLEYWRQEALKRFNANYVGSIYSGMVIIGGVCSGAFFFQEFRTMSPLHLVIFGGSVLISIGGTAMLTLYGDDIESLISEDDECSPLTEGTEGTMTANQGMTGGIHCDL